MRPQANLRAEPPERPWSKTEAGASTKSPGQWGMIRKSVQRFSDEIMPKQFESGVTVVGFGRRLNWKARAMIGKKEGRPEAAFATTVRRGWA
jgi:hypothetical protein